MPRSGQLCPLVLVLALLAGCGTASNSNTTTREGSSADLAAATPVSPVTALGVGGAYIPAQSAAVRCVTPDRRAIQGSGSTGEDKNLVVVGALNLRSGPGVDCDLVGLLGFGTHVSAIGPEIVGQDRTCFAYPIGHFNDTTIAAVQSAGYEIAFGANVGQGSLASLNRWNVPRIEVSGEWTLEDFIAIMEDVQRRS